jgi:predicted RNase H-like HicB family nuclease
MNTNAGKTITLCYVAIILKEPDESYWATVPDLGACFAIGKTIAQAKADLAAALELHIEGMRAEMMAMPPARHRDEILADVDHDLVEDYVVEIKVEPLARMLHGITSKSWPRPT